MKSKLATTTAEYKATRAESKQRAKAKALEWKEMKAAKTEKVKPGFFNPSKYRSWMTGNGQRGQL